MKKQFRFAIVAAALAASVMSCDSNDDNKTTPQPDVRLQDQAIAAAKIVADGQGTGAVAGELSFAVGLDHTSEAKPGSYDLVLTEGELTDDQLSWTGNVSISGAIKVPAGKTLEIAAGTHVFAKNENDQASGAYLMVLKGAKIEAVGTAQDMIVFTSELKQPGAWGGVLINGNAPINNGDSNGEASPEVDSNVKYGGNDAADNSGMLKYVRVEYTGYKYNDESEHNGFTFSGVGNGTVLENLQAWKGTDDGLEWFGGTVNGTNLVSTGNEDDSFDWAHGFVGNLTNLWVEHDASREFDKAFEIDNNSKNNSAEPYSNATVKNVTVMGVAGETTAFRVREGAKGTFENIKVMNAKKGFDVHNDVTITNVLNDEVVVSKYTVDGVDSEVEYVDDCETCE
ncbi:hypothetical protein KMW28_17590 [Flammeovirga yaeyamensis]|uniref:Lipoprotein n=1 Tax=Flammeovirga yaeyamensis TaxID=367791 RepID=A0AAX1N2I4_9BACT|nr:hypothetical protein [Flammeovirga yaeyamensis]MBB3698165.1 hypothetical protein [Flammeovirga yaeyamensis]NMF34478.1 hypothetical protein [Flammeovirga yaeyamensis]QWG01457.1 hypothetical protein KMW28_17590 [Flammeovirga yaeyamensis]